MEIAEHIDVLEEQGAAIAATAARIGLETKVPSCPAWTVRDLVAHTSQIHRWATIFVRDGPAALVDGQRPSLPDAPADGVLDWYVEGHRQLVAALRTAPADLDSWTFLPAPSPLAFWARRQAHETAIHWADAAEAAGDVVPSYSAAFAADGVDELLAGVMGRPGGRLAGEQTGSLLVAPTDVAERWHVLFGPDAHGSRVAADAEPPADCTVSGPASDLYLFLWNRRPAEPPGMTGASRVLDLWRERGRV